MKVSDLVENSLWIPGTGYDRAVAPKISVLLPTFRRGKSGLFRRAAESILNQTLTEIELIIIDDASTDGTANQIDEFMALDGRVSCIRHMKNIGLPAISEYEGYMRARGPRIAFAFDDTMFHEDALEKLLEESEKSPHAMIYGHIEWSYREPKTGEIVNMRLGSTRSQGLLRTGNAIPNNAVLLPREIIEDVGLYDPHVVLARVCDWDLWCRVAERYEIKFVDVSVGREDGPMTNDSLGNTYSLDSWAVDEWMRTNRNEKLRPANFGEYEVFAAYADQSISTRSVIDSMAKKHAAMRGWKVPEQADAGSSEGHILVVNLHYDASTFLCFEMLPPEIAKRVRVITYNTWFGVEEIARASCVIFVRHVNAFRPWIDAAKTLGVPMYFYMDDNLPLMVQLGETTVLHEDYRIPKFREDMKLFKGVLLTSPHLVTYFRENLFHDNPIYFPVSFHDQSPLAVDFYEDKRPGEVTVVFAGGAHRSAGLWEVVVPALKKLAAEGASIHLVGPKSDDLLYDDDLKNLPENMRITGLPFEIGYLFAMRRFARYRPDFVVHAPSSTKNNTYKTLHPLVSAVMMDAVAVLPDGEPYDAVKQTGNAIIVDDAAKPLSWYQAFKSLVSGQHDFEAVKARNRIFCAEHFSGKENVRVLTQILRENGGEVSWSEQARRLHKLAAWFRQTTGLQVADIDVDPMDKQALLLAEYRKITRYSWRHRLMAKSSDLWDTVSPRFHRLKATAEKYGWRRLGSSLELSDSLHDIPYREYRVNPKEGKLVAVWLALAVDSVRRGQIGIEIVTPSNEIKDNRVLDIATLKLDEPVRFELSDVYIRKGETWAIRVFANTNTPIYTYEFINKGMFGLRFKNPTPFMAFDIE